MTCTLLPQSWTTTPQSGLCSSSSSILCHFSRLVLKPKQLGFFCMRTEYKSPGHPQEEDLWDFLGTRPCTWGTPRLRTSAVSHDTILRFGTCFGPFGRNLRNHLQKLWTCPSAATFFSGSLPTCTSSKDREECSQASFLPWNTPAHDTWPSSGCLFGFATAFPGKTVPPLPCMTLLLSFFSGFC